MTEVKFVKATKIDLKQGEAALVFHENGDAEIVVAEYPDDGKISTGQWASGICLRFLTLPEFFKPVHDICLKEIEEVKARAKERKE